MQGQTKEKEKFDKSKNKMSNIKARGGTNKISKEK